MAALDFCWEMGGSTTPAKIFSKPITTRTPGVDCTLRLGIQSSPIPGTTKTAARWMCNPSACIWSSKRAGELHLLVRCIRRHRQCVDHFAGPGVMHLLTRFIFNRVAVAFQTLVVQSQIFVFLLKTQNLLMQLLGLVLLLLVGDDAIMAEDGVEAQRHG